MLLFPQRFPLPCPLLFPPIHWASSPSPLFLPLLSLPGAVWPTAFIACCLHVSLPGASGDDKEFVLVPSSAFIRERKRRKKKKKATELWKFAGRQYLGRVTSVLLSLHAALQLARGRDDSGCSRWSLLHCSQPLRRANVVSWLLLPAPACRRGLRRGGRHRGTELPSLHSNVIAYHCLFPASGLPGVNIAAAKVAPYFNQKSPPKSFRAVPLSGLRLFPCPLWWESLVKQVCLIQP